MGVTDVYVGGFPLEPNRDYKMATLEWVAEGGDDYSMFAVQRQVVTPEHGPQIHDVIVKYLCGSAPVLHFPASEGRVRNVRPFQISIDFRRSDEHRKTHKTKQNVTLMFGNPDTDATCKRNGRVKSTKGKLMEHFDS